MLLLKLRYAKEIEGGIIALGNGNLAHIFMSVVQEIHAYLTCGCMSPESSNHDGRITKALTVLE